MYQSIISSVKNNIKQRLIVLGAIAILAGFIPNFKQIAFILLNSNDYRLTSATVINTFFNRPMVHVNVCFNLADGKVHYAVYEVYSDKSKNGDIVEIFYQVSNPDNIVRKGYNFTQMIIWGTIGLALIIFAIFFIKKKPDQPNRLNYDNHSKK